MASRRMSWNKSRRNLLWFAVGVILITAIFLGISAYGEGGKENDISSEVDNFKVEENTVSSQIKEQEIPVDNGNVTNISEEGLTPPFHDGINSVDTPETSGQTTDMVSDVFFNGALFIGDSRTQGLMMYSGIEGATFYTEKGLTVSDVFEKAFVDSGSGKITISNALYINSFDKVYIMLGANELGWVYPEKYIEKYGILIDQIQETQPGARVYVQSILPVSQAKSESDSMVNNDRINQYNEMLLQMTLEKGAVYVNVRDAVKDETGALHPDASTDGVHLTKEYCIRWVDYLREYTAEQ